LASLFLNFFLKFTFIDFPTVNNISNYDLEYTLGIHFGVSLLLKGYFVGQISASEQYFWSKSSYG